MSEKKLIFFLILILECVIIFWLLSNLQLNRIGFFTVVNKEQIYRVEYGMGLNKSEKVIYRLRPNFEQKYNGLSVKLPRTTIIKINSDGFRDHEYSIEKPNNTFRIIVLGDSFTFGLGVNIEETYDKFLENKLNSLNNGINYQVMNFGVPGYDTYDEIEMLKEKGLKYNPDMIIIGYMSNDIENNTRNKELNLQIFKETEEEYKNLSANERDYLIITEANQILMSEIKKKPFKEIWETVEGPLNELSHITKKRNITVLIYTFFQAENHFYEEEQKLALKKIVDKNRWHILDANFYSEYPMSSLIFDLQDHHPNNFAHELIGDQIFNYLLSNKVI